MPVGGDLGFSYLVLVVVLVVPVIGFLVRRKWRISVARNEEIKRLLVLAKEEAARAELETTFGYAVPPAVTFSRPLQYECAVCFCPTTTRCARCKAVRYCSGKCQIIHWRQGHKEECRPFTTYQSNDAGGGSFQKVLKQEDSEIHGISFESEGRQRAKSVKNFLKEPASSKSGSTPEVFHGNDGTEVEFPADGKDKNVSLHEAERSDGDQPTNIFPDKPMTSSVKNVNQNGPPSSKRTILVDSIDCLTSSGKLNEVKPDYADHNSQCGSTSSSGWSADGSNESSFSEPSTPSSGFWEGNINSSKLKMDALDDCAQSSSGGAGDADLRNSQSSLSCSFKPHGNVIPPLVEQDSGAKTITSDEHCSTTLGIKKPMDRAVLSQEKSADASKGRSSPLASPKNSDYIDVCMSSDSPVSKSGEPRFYSSGTYVSGRPSISTRASKASSMHSLGPEKSNHLVDDTRSISSSDFIAHPSSSTRRQSLQGENPGKVENAHAIASETANYSPNTKNGLTTSMRKVVDQFRTSKSSRHYQSEVGSEISGRYNNKGLFPYELFVTLYNWNKVELRPFGLTNCGNSCYANAVLQCLACTPPLTAYLLQGLHSKACERKEWCFTCEFESLILKGKEGTSPVSPIGILSQIQNIGSHLGNGREEDAHEFLRYAIDTMQSVCLKEAGVNASRSLEEESTLVGLTFGGYLRSKIKCMKCGGKSERHERMMDLTVEIEGDIGTLEEALRKFTGTEILDGDNKYQCGRCRSYERAKKKLTVLEAPNILTIALKRFQSGKFGKLNKSIQFPEILDLAPYMSRTSDNSPVYRLYGVVVHLDVMNAAFSGHYVCYVKTGQKKWFEIDDSKVKAVELENVLTRRAYMLLYARYSPRAPRFIRNSIIPPDPRRTKNPIFKSRVHPTGPWDALNGHNSIDGFHPIHTNFIRPILEEDSSSDNSSSIFSEECSRSTGSSSNKDSTSADDYDHLFVEPGGNWNTLWKNASDSDSSSSCSSSSPIPSPLHTRHSPIAAESDRTEASGFQTRNAKFDADGNDFWGRLPTRNPVLYSDTAKQCRKLESSSSCRETDSSRLGRANPKADVPFRRPTGKRTD